MRLSTPRSALGVSPSSRGLLLGAPVPTQAGLPPAGLVEAVTNALSEKGYAVSGKIESDQNPSGPGVEYFADSAAQTAANVVTIVNEVFAHFANTLEDSHPLTARKVNMENSPRLLGLWLY